MQASADVLVLLRPSPVEPPETPSLLPPSLD